MQCYNFVEKLNYLLTDFKIHTNAGLYVESITVYIDVKQIGKFYWNS